MKRISRIMLLGSGELGKEVVIAAQRLGQYVVAVDKYENAPAMQVADDFEVIDMLDGDQLTEIVQKHRPHIIIPEIEAIRTEKLKEFEKQGVFVVPTAEAAHLTMNRDAIRDVASKELGLKTARYAYAETYEELEQATNKVGIPCVVKPVMSSSGKGQSTVKSRSGVKKAWEAALQGRRGDQVRVIVEEFIPFEFEITLLTLKQKRGPTMFLPPIGHRQEKGDYRESWMPADMKTSQLRKAKRMAKKMTDRLGGAGIFGVEFFVTKDDVYFSELSPRPHDTGMVTMISQDLSEFDLHIRAVLGLPVRQVKQLGPAASAVILANKESEQVTGYSGLRKALALKDTDIRIFGKPTTRKGRRMGVALARGRNVKAARRMAEKAASYIRIHY